MQACRRAVITAIWARIPAPTPAPVPLQPDDARLVDLVRLIKSGMSESIIAEQVRQSGQAYNLSVNDLLYLKQNGAQESTIAALMATPAGGPGRAGRRSGRAGLRRPGAGETEVLRRRIATVAWSCRVTPSAWEDRRDPTKNFTFQTTGLEKVWFTCEARTPENFCYQINFQIVKGDRYRFQDSDRESGSNAAVIKVMEALRTYFPRLTFGAPSIDD